MMDLKLAFLLMLSVYCAKTDGLDEKKGRCPKADVGICQISEPSCTKDSECKGKNKCCSNPCGGLSCQPPEPENDDEKKGRCPDAEFGTCQISEPSCTKDSECKGKKKCCSNPCGGMSCQPPAKDKEDEKKGRCPDAEFGTCQISEPSCTKDSECKGKNKCCSNPCGGMSCQPPAKVKEEKNLFVCPVLNQCSSNDECKGNRACCPDDCGFRTCKKTERISKGKRACPAQKVTLPLRDECENDDGCPGRRKKCCPNTCGVKTCKKAEKIDCSNIQCADPGCSPDEIAYRPKHSCCQLCKRNCSKILCRLIVCEEGDKQIIPEEDCCPICVEDCRGKQCHPINCKPGEIEYKPEGKCCKICKQDCSTVKCAEPVCKPGYVVHQPETQCCKTCKKDCSATLCLRPTCKSEEELFTPDDECCPLCKKPQDCYDKKLGVIYKDGATFRSSCNSCTCKNGVITCTEIACEEGYCISGLKPHPEAVCDENKECSLKGYKCEKSIKCCREPNCPKALSLTFCALDHGCPLGYKCNFLEEGGNGFCCKAKPCFKKGVLYESGESFKDQCNDCFCDDGDVVCTKKLCRPCIQADGVSYPDGSTYKVQCNTCGCSDGRELCTLIACEGCTSGLQADGPCNPNIPNSCHTKGFECEPNGKSGICCKQPTCDGALTTTYCSKNGLICPSRYYCQLDGSEEGLGFCCLAKPCFVNGVKYESGESFKDKCNDCFCNNGVAACTKKGCPKPCFRYDVRYESGVSFKDNCNDCVCTDGLAVCSNNPCSDCTFQGVTYKEGAAVKIEDECGECICVKTGDKDSPKFEVKCPKCCVRDNQVFHTGEGFKGLTVCEECSCEVEKEETHANVICALRACPNCDGLPEEGECCPVCSHEPEL